MARRQLEAAIGCNCATARAGISRRRVLLQAGAGLLTSTLLPAAAAAQTAMTPDVALAAMMDGNKRFVQGRLESCQDDLSILRDKTVARQEPFAAVLSCADSRVPVELIFDQSIGHVFVTRVAGNIAGADIIASLEYGATVLGARTIIVLGHSNCGAVKAAIEGKPVPGQISTLYRSLRPAVERANGDLTAAIKANAQIQAALLRESSPVLAELLQQDQLGVVAGYYDLETGEVSLLS